MDLPTQHKVPADALGFAHWIAGTFSKHITQVRHKFDTTREVSRKFSAFMKSLYTGSFFGKGEDELELLHDVVKPFDDLYLKNSKSHAYKIEKVGGDSLCLYWPEDVAIGDFCYTPLAIRIAVVKRPEDWPNLTFYKGIPVLRLRDLAWDFKRLTGDTEENFTHRRLKTATGTLVDLLTRYENSGGGTPWVRSGR